MEEFEKLINMMAAARIPFEAHRREDGTLQMEYPSGGNRIASVIFGPYSYGYDCGLLEMMGLVSRDCHDNVRGFMTAEVVFEKISADYKERTNQ